MPAAWLEGPEVMEISEEDYDYVVDINQKVLFLSNIAKWMAKVSRQNPERLSCHYHSPRYLR
jgi:hypothetical protein